MSAYRLAEIDRCPNCGGWRIIGDPCPTCSGHYRETYTSERLDKNYELCGKCGQEWPCDYANGKDT